MIYLINPKTFKLKHDYGYFFEIQIINGTKWENTDMICGRKVGMGEMWDCPVSGSGTTNQLVLMSPSYLPYMLLSLQLILSC